MHKMTNGKNSVASYPGLFTSTVTNARVRRPGYEAKIQQVTYSITRSHFHNIHRLS